MHCQYLEQRWRGRDPSEYSALRLDHREPGLVEFWEIRGTAIRQHDAAEAAIISLAYSGVDADFACDATHQQRLDAAVAQHQLEISLAERTLARLVDHRLAGNRIKLGDDVVTGLAANE